MKQKELVLITGGAGFIGSHTSDLLIKKGYKVRLLDNLSALSHSGKWPKYINKNVLKMQGDVRVKKDLIKALDGVSYVIHLAAVMDLTPDFSKFFDVNTVGTAKIYEVIVENKFPIKKVVIASSQFVYGQGLWNCKKDGKNYPRRLDLDLINKVWDPVCAKCGGKLTYLKNTEENVDPTNQYSISKYTQELIALNLGKSFGIPSTALRYSIVHGSRQSIKSLYSGALRQFTLLLRTKKPIYVYEDGNQLRDFVSVRDVARANVFAMESKKTNFEVFNVGGGEVFTVRDLVSLIGKKFDMNPTVKESGLYRIGDIRHAVSSIDKIKKIGWKPVFTEAQSVGEFVDWVDLVNPSDKDVEKALSAAEKKVTFGKVKS